uniref:Protein Nef n=1 Tax=Human immunodeficiency virus type 1 TaxID=11676 RepID=A0A248X9B9_HV1|nr:nef protein [Human immunodeficiency virus 1]
MGSKSSKSSVVGWPVIRERIRRDEPAADGVGALSGDLERHGAITSSTAADNNADSAWLEPQEEKEVVFPVRHQLLLRPMTYTAVVDIRHFLKEKGGEDGIIYSQKRQVIHDLLFYHPQVFFHDRQSSTPAPVISSPTTWGWCYKVVPVTPEEVEANEGENNRLLHPMSLHGMEDPEREVLKWEFDSRLAFRHVAREIHPEYYKNC